MSIYIIIQVIRDYFNINLLLECPLYYTGTRIEYWQRGLGWSNRGEKQCEAMREGLCVVLDTNRMRVRVNMHGLTIDRDLTLTGTTKKPDG